MKEVYIQVITKTENCIISGTHTSIDVLQRQVDHINILLNSTENFVENLCRKFDYFVVKDKQINPTEITYVIDVSTGLVNYTD